MRLWVKVFLIMILLPILIGGVVLLLAGRPLAFQVLQQRTASKFPEVQWITTEDLARWRADSSRAQPVVLDARTEPEFEVSHLKGATLIDPDKPSLRPLQGMPRDTALVLYSSAGYRGARVASWLAKAGYTKGLNLSGGLFLWANEARPLLKGDNRPTALVHPYDPRWGLLVEKRYRAAVPEVRTPSAAP